jgi:hypothetical protein
MIELTARQQQIIDIVENQKVASISNIANQLKERVSIPEVLRRTYRIDNIFNVAAILVHESYHLGVLKYNLKLNNDYEEYLAYRYEYNFLMKIFVW